jgi:hypothetical protein
LCQFRLRRLCQIASFASFVCAAIRIVCAAIRIVCAATDIFLLRRQKYLTW